MANIRREKIDLSQEMQILINMVTSTQFLSKIQTVSNLKYFESSYSKMLCSWIWEYYSITNEAPGKNLEDIFVKKRRTISDQDDEDMIIKFLSNLSKTWDGKELKNLDFAVNSAIDYFKIQSFKALSDQISSAITSGDAQEAENLLARYKKVAIPETETLNFMKTPNEIKRAFTDESEVVFQLSGNLGIITGPLCRGDFLAVQAPPKRGKTFTMIDWARQAVLQGNKTLFVSLEMSRKQTIRRFWQAFQGKSIKAQKRRCLSITNEDGFPELEHSTFKTEELDLSDKNLEKQTKKYLRHTRGSGDLRIEVRPTNTFSPSDLKTLLDNLEYYDGFIPDVIVIDYADIMIPDNSRLDYRHQLDSIWKSLRGIATDMNNVVITGSQGGIRKGKKDSGKEDIAEDGRKLAHVTKLVIMNQTDTEKDWQLMRYSCPLVREGRTYSDEVLVTQALEISRAWTGDAFCRDLRYDKEKLEKYEE